VNKRSKSLYVRYAKEEEEEEEEEEEDGAGDGEVDDNDNDEVSDDDDDDDDDDEDDDDEDADASEFSEFSDGEDDDDDDEDEDSYDDDASECSGGEDDDTCRQKLSALKHTITHVKSQNKTRFSNACVTPKSTRTRALNVDIALHPQILRDVQASGCLDYLTKGICFLFVIICHYFTISSPVSCPYMFCRHKARH
jgi:hypothetical protein